MTILKDGVVENPKKRLMLGGNYSNFDLDDLKACQARTGMHAPQATLYAPAAADGAFSSRGR